MIPPKTNSSKYEEAHKLLSEVKVAVSKLESLGADYSVFRGATLVNSILKQMKKKLDYIK